jgi:hypothetical protein
MFGRDWEPAEATIVARRLISLSHNDGYGSTFQSFEYVADVRPKSAAAPFRATIRDPWNQIHFKQPDVGQVVPVKFHRKDQQVKFDAADPTLREPASINKRDKQTVAAAHSGEAQAQWEAIAGGAPGSPAKEVPADAGGRSPLQADFSGMMAEALATAGRLSAASANVAETIAAIKRARAAGDLAEVERLKLEFTTRSGQDVVAAREAAADFRARAADSDPLERLEKLADLHDRGVLSDAEFAAQKAKLLGE